MTEVHDRDWIELTARAAFASHRLVGWIYWDPVAIDHYTALGPDAFSYDISRYDAVFLAGGWGAAFDFAQSEALARDDRGERVGFGDRRGVPRSARSRERHGCRPSPARRGPQGLGRDRQAGARARDRIDAQAPREMMQLLDRN